MIPFVQFLTTDHYMKLVVIAVIVVSRHAASIFMGRQMPHRDEKSQQVCAVLRQICDVYGFSEMMPAFCFPFGHDRSTATIL